jgi:hypothetical protein
MLETMCRKSRSRQLRKLWIVPVLLSVACVAAAQQAPTPGAGGPTGPPPTGQVWVQSGAQWVMAPAPPSDGPYQWVNGQWVPTQAAPPPGTEWIPGHWTTTGWIPGYWAPVPPAAPGLTWVAGHWGPAGRWIPGHWAGQIPSGQQWVAGHWDGGIWVHGHWVGGPQAASTWVPGHYGPAGRWIPGHWR